MDEIEAGTQTFLELLRDVDSAVEAVIPVTPSNGMFLISLTKASNRKFITVPEEDLIDLPNEPDIHKKVKAMVQEAVQAL